MDAIQGLFPAESENIRMVNHSGLFHSFPDFDLVCIHWSAVGAIFPGHAGGRRGLTGLEGMNYPFGPQGGFHVRIKAREKIQTSPGKMAFANCPILVGQAEVESRRISYLANPRRRQKFGSGKSPFASGGSWL